MPKIAANVEFASAQFADPLAVQVTPAASANSQLAAEQTFSMFDAISTQLNDSYSALEGRVASLRDELAQTSAQRTQELAEKERLANRLQHLLDVLPGAVIVLDAQGRISEANPAAVDLFGQGLSGTLWRDVIARSFAPREDDGHEVSLKDGRRVSIATRSLAPEPGQLVVLNDLTDTRRLQEQLARHERLSSLGRMVASLAHQIRTPLSAALLYASHLTEQALPVATQQRFAGRLKERLHELEHQVRDMLVFARGELPMTERLTPNALFTAIQDAAQTHVQDVAVRWQCDTDDDLVLCNRDTLVGAVLNMLDNAVQAAKGRITPGGPFIKVHLYRRDDTLYLSVSDSGAGIDKPTLARLGEPFFTTKTNGTGLGIAVVKAVARAHRGDLRIFSRVGRGTCARITLPLIPAMLDATAACATE